MAIYLCPHYWSGGLDESPSDDAPRPPLTVKMRSATASIHDVADAAVNAKLVLAFTSARTYGAMHRLLMENTLSQQHYADTRARTM